MWIQDPGFAPKSSWKLSTQHFEYYFKEKIGEIETITRMKLLEQTISVASTIDLTWIEN